MVSAYYAVSDSLKQIHKLLESATSLNTALEGSTGNGEEIEPIVIGRESMIEKRKQQHVEKEKKERKKRNNRKILIVIGFQIEKKDYVG
jgi:hypothetical protein